MRISDAAATEKFPVSQRNFECVLKSPKVVRTADFCASVEFSGDSYKNDFTDCADYSDFETEERYARLRGNSAN